MRTLDAVTKCGHKMRTFCAENGEWPLLDSPKSADICKNVICGVPKSGIVGPDVRTDGRYFQKKCDKSQFLPKKRNKNPIFKWTFKPFKGKALFNLIKISQFFSAEQKKIGKIFKTGRGGCCVCVCMRVCVLLWGLLCARMCICEWTLGNLIR